MWTQWFVRCRPTENIVNSKHIVAGLPGKIGHIFLLPDCFLAELYNSVGDGLPSPSGKQAISSRKTSKYNEISWFSRISRFFDINRDLNRCRSRYHPLSHDVPDVRLQFRLAQHIDINLFAAIHKSFFDVRICERVILIQQMLHLCDRICCNSGSFHFYFKWQRKAAYARILWYAAPSGDPRDKNISSIRCMEYLTGIFIRAFLKMRNNFGVKCFPSKSPCSTSKKCPAFLVHTETARIYPSSHGTKDGHSQNMQSSYSWSTPI